ncbi:hypothetical protein BJV82DRAFT_612224 [Fennellomyces sp. T-0311]|nr:hypothetical protein BJV82DRAFT_612224 [Fennellomyces sp. T-0311]
MANPTDSEDPCIDSNVPAQQPLSMQQFGFLGTLPSDIILSIFAFFNQQDCLTCMAVCRDWYNVVPQYAKSAWTTIHVQRNDGITENVRQIRCLGNHVKNVTLEKLKEQDLCFIMHMLVEWGCTKIRYLELSECGTSMNQELFLVVLRNLAPHLTELKILQHESSIPFLHVLDACPNISHFTFWPSIRARWRENMYDEEPFVKTKLSTTQFTHITYLCLDVVLNKKLRLDPILKRCPRLRWFIGASTNKQPTHSDISYVTMSIDLDTILNWCPKLVCFQDNLSYNVWKDKFAYTTDTGDDGIHYLSQCQDYGLDQVALNLSKVRDTLEYFSLRVCVQPHEAIDWSPVFRTLQLPNLRALYLYDSIHFDVASFFTMFNHSPLMETLVLGCHHISLDTPAIETLQIMPRLRSLELFSIFPLKDDTLFLLLDRLPVLEQLMIRDSTVPLMLPYTNHQCPTQLKLLDLTSVTFDYHGDESITKEEAVAYFIQYFFTHSKIETVHLTNVPFIGAIALKTIASIPTLKACQIELDETLPLEDTQAGLLSFVIMLQQTTIKRLQICRLQRVSFEVLEAIGSLPLLLEVSIPEEPLFSQSGFTRVDGLGLVQMLRKSRSLRDVALENVIVEHPEQVAYYDNLTALLEQEMPFYTISGSPQVKDFPSEESFIYELFVKRRIH